MKIAITSQDKRHVTGHAGRCQNFWVFETNEQGTITKSLLELPKEQSFHNSSPHQPHPLDGVQVLISGGMGQGLMHRLQNHGIEGIITKETDLEKAVSAYLDGSLVREDPESHEHGHDHDHDHDHDH